MDIKESDRVKELKHKSRRLSIKGGIFSSMKESFGGNYLSPFAIAINSSNSLVAMLNSIQGLLGPLSQLYGSKLIEKTSRKKVVIRSVFFESLIWLPLMAIAFLFYKEIITGFLPLFLLIFFSIYIILANVSHPAWFSWMGDIVDEKYRGRWFSKRNLFIETFSLIFAVSSAFFLDYFKKTENVMIGFIILFLLAFLSRLTCWRIFRKQYNPKIKISKKDYFSFGEFLKKAPSTNFGKFAIFRALLNFSMAIYSSVLAIFLLRNLQLNYLHYIIIIFSATVFSLIVTEIWGKITDKYGNYFVLVITTIFIPIIPLIWILSPSLAYLILIPGIIRGVFWTGFNLATVNFIYDNVRNQKRGLAVSYFNMLSGIGIFLGATTSAILIKYLHIGKIEPVSAIFIFSSLLSMLVVFFGITQIREIKKKKKMSGIKDFETFVVKQVKPTLLEEAHEIISVKKYFNKP